MLCPFGPSTVRTMLLFGVSVLIFGLGVALAFIFFASGVKLLSTQPIRERLTASAPSFCWRAGADHRPNTFLRALHTTPF